MTALLLAGCSHSSSPTPTGSRALPVPAGTVNSRPKALSAQDFADLFQSLSESRMLPPTTHLVSSHTSYLKIIRQLALRATPGGAYIGVGSEQNLSYIAVTRPRIAFIVDQDRDAALLQLLYKAIFKVAKTRAQFLSLLLGRTYDPAAPGVRSTITRVVAVVRAEQRDKPATFAKQSAALRASIDKSVSLDAGDLAALKDIQQKFFDRQFKLRYSPDSPGSRTYPTLAELVTAKDSVGKPHSFLATIKEFYAIRNLERENRVIPVVGTLGGKHTLSAIATELQRRHLKVSVFYVSNQERQLLHTGTWQRWVKNVETLPHDLRSLFVRDYQGTSHSATELGYVNRFVSVEHAGGYRTYRQLATDHNGY